MFFYFILATLAWSVLGSVSSDVLPSEWEHLPEHMTICRRDTCWGVVSWSELYTKVVLQDDIDQYRCFFAHQLAKKPESVVCALTISICKKEQSIIEMVETTALWGKEHRKECVVQVCFEDQAIVGKTCVQIRSCKRKKTWDAPITEFNQVGVRPSLQVHNGTLCIVADQKRVLDILPYTDYLSVKHHAKFYIPKPTMIYDCRCLSSLQSKGKLMIGPKLLLRGLACLAEMGLDQQTVQTWDIVRRSACHNQPEQTYARRFCVRPCGSAGPGFGVKVTSGDVVTLTSFDGAVRVDGVHYPLMNIKYGELKDAESNRKSINIMCALQCVEDAMALKLYALSEKTLLLGCFYFAPSDLNSAARLMLYCGDEQPYLKYPIAHNLSLEVRFGLESDSSIFYISNANARGAHIAFFGGRGGVLWRQQFSGVPEFVLDTSSVCGGVEQKLHIGAIPQTLFSIRPHKSMLHALLFKYQILPVDDHYCMCITTQTPLWTMSANIHEINVQLSATDLQNHPLRAFVEGALVVVQISPRSQMYLVFNTKTSALYVSLVAKTCIQELCRFSFLSDEVVQRPTHTLAVADRAISHLKSNVSFIFSEKGWGIASINDFQVGGVTWRRDTQLLVRDDQCVMIWGLWNGCAQEQTMCQFYMENNSSNNVLFYYTCVAYHGNEGQLKACGGVFVDMQKGNVFVRKASAEQRRSITDLDQMPRQAEHWKDSIIFAHIPFRSKPMLVGVPDGVRPVFGDDSGKRMAFAPMQEGSLFRSSKRLFAEIIGGMAPVKCYPVIFENIELCE